MTIQPLTPDVPHRAYWMPDLEWGRALWHAHTPYCYARWCEEYDDVMGIGGYVNHGDSALLDLLYVHPDETGRGYGTALLQDLLAHADSENIATVVAHVRPALVPWLQRHGFAPHGEILRCTGGRFLQATLDEVEPMEAQHLLGVLHLDRRATGEDRRTWLMEHGYLGSVYNERGRIRGFVLPLLRDALIVADAPEVGLELQRWVFPVQEHLLIPATNSAALQHLHERGYTSTVDTVRLVRGVVPDYKGELVYGFA
jgi:GNAT superfamily N-acetyltransferase